FDTSFPIKDTLQKIIDNPVTISTGELLAQPEVQKLLGPMLQRHRSYETNAMDVGPDFVDVALLEPKLGRVLFTCGVGKVQVRIGGVNVTALLDPGRSNLIASLANMDKVPGDDTSIQTDLEQERQRSGNPSTLGSSRVEAGSSSQSSAHPHPSGASTTSHGRGAPPHASHHAPPLPRLASQPLEGIAAGFTKYSSQTDTSKRLLENLGTDIPLAKERMDDEQLNYEQFSRATDNQIDILKDLAKAEVDPIKEQLLQEEADIWELAYLRCAKDDRTKRRWPMMAKSQAPSPSSLQR
ncbi:unnamed protein product, partial [Tilletia controversa]